MSVLRGERGETPAGLRARQDREIATAHALTSAEHALALEATLIGEAFASAGLAFDPRTFVAMRVMESSIAEDLDPLDALGTPVLRGLIERSARLSDRLLDGEA